jgi:hypothetical protein
MKGLYAVLVLAVVFVGASIWACSERTSAESDGLTPADSTLLERAKVRQERLKQGPYMTVIGRGLDLDGFVSAERQQPVPIEVFQGLSEFLESRFTVALPLGAEGEEAVRVSMDSTSADEGDLFRVHVAMLDPETSFGVVAVVLGLYDRMWSEAAIGDQALPCIRCGRVLVCASNPTCNGD